MRREVVLVILLVPLTAVIAAAVTNLVMRDLAPAAPLPVVRPIPVAKAAPTSATPVATILAPVPAQIERPRLDLASAEVSAPTPPPTQPEEDRTPAIRTTAATGDEAATKTAVDFIRLSEDMQRVSEALERFNTKLLRLIDGARSGQGDDSSAGPGETAGDEPAEREAGP